MFLLGFVALILTVAILLSFILLIVIYGNSKNSPVTNGRIKLLQYLTISNLVGQVVVMVLIIHRSNDDDDDDDDGSSILVLILGMTLYFALYAAIIFGLFLGLNLCIFLFQLSINQNVYYFPREILSRWKTYERSAIVIPFLLGLSDFVFSNLKDEYYFVVTIRGFVILLSIMSNILAFISSLFLSSRWMQLRLSDQEKKRAHSLINKYFIPTLLWYPLCEAIGQVPICIYVYYYAWNNKPEQDSVKALLILLWLLSFPATSIAHLILFILIEKPEFNWIILLQRLNMLWIIDTFHFLIQVPPNNLTQAVQQYVALDDENTDNEPLDELNQIISSAQNIHLEAV